MATVEFLEGKDYVNENGWPEVVYFLLSELSVEDGTLTKRSTLSEGLGEITGTGYARISQPRPRSVNQTFSFAKLTWRTRGATDWSSEVRSIIAVSSPGNDGIALYAWDTPHVRNLATPGLDYAVQVSYTA